MQNCHYFGATKLRCHERAATELWSTEGMAFGRVADEQLATERQRLSGQRTSGQRSSGQRSNPQATNRHHPSYWVKSYQRGCP
ncbi:hypothetical protein [Paenibacillus sp. GCM10012306]|uniref:hypothetical protein n=1 Tax=Paenibacillus sp. GCM10012306 TaxID=3317342 RepID=UPI0036D2F8FA